MTTLANKNVSERYDLQRLLRERIEILVPEGYVITDEFGSWEESQRRIDLLCTDKEGRLIIVELKRGLTGSHMELQALRYAAMASAMNFDQAVDAHASYLKRIGGTEDARERLLHFLEWTNEDTVKFAEDVRIVLVSEDFDKELTTTVLWLNEYELDITCFRLVSYEVGSVHLLHVEQVIPLLEATEYQVRLREKKREASRKHSQRDYTKYDVTCEGEVFRGLAKRNAIWRVAYYLCTRQGVKPQEIQDLIEWRSNLWASTDGELDESTFRVAMEEQRRRAGKQWDASRWFRAEGELIHCDGKTWALTNGWGLRTDEALRRITDRWKAVSFAESEN